MTVQTFIPNGAKGRFKPSFPMVPKLPQKTLLPSQRTPLMFQ